MKPRRSVSSVVNELILGLRSGEITIGEHSSEQAITPRDTSTKRYHAAFEKYYRDVLEHQWKVLNEVSRNVVIVRSVTQADVRLECARSAERLWVYVGALPNQPEISFVDLATQCSLSLQEVRILVSYSVESKVVPFFRNRGVRNIRVSSIAAKDQIALADHTLFWSRISQPHATFHQGTAVPSMHILRVDENAVPGRLRDVEQFFDAAWSEASQSNTI